MRSAYLLNRPQKLFVMCSAVFITALVIAEATAGKFFTAFHLPFPLVIFGETFQRVTMTAGVLAFPITFIVTDVMNEYFGKKGIRYVTMIGVAMIIFEFILLRLAIGVPVDPVSPVSQGAFEEVFQSANRVILGSITAYLLGQLADITLFHWLRQLTHGRHLWLRATGSTLGSQFIDTFIVLTIAFLGQISFQTILAITVFNYAYKFILAILITPIIYGAHWMMDRYLGSETAEALIRQAEAGQEVRTS